MPPPRQPDDVMFQLGQISAQLRELIHSTNNTSTKIDALAIRVTALETEHARRKGADGVWTLILKSPAVGWLIGAAAAVWALLSGRVQP